MSILLKNIIFLTIVQFVNYLAPFIALPYLSRVLSIEFFGLSMVLISLINLSTILTDFGFQLSSTHWISKNRLNPDAISAHIGSVFALKFFLILISSIYMYVYIYFFLDYLYLNKDILFLLSMSIIFFQAYQPIWLFQGIEKMYYITIAITLSKVSYIFLVFIFVKTEYDINSLLLSLLISNIVATLFSILAIYINKYKISYPTYLSIKQVFFNSLPFFLSRAASSVYTTANTFVIGTFSGLEQAAIYSSTEKLYQAGKNIVTPISQALFPNLTNTPNYKLLYKFIGITLIPLTIICIIASFYTSDILYLIYGEKYISGNATLVVFLICIIITFININFGYPAFTIVNRLDIANKTVFIGAVIQAAILIFLYYTNGISSINIAYSVLFTESAVMVIRIILFYSCLNKIKTCILESKDYD